MSEESQKVRENQNTDGEIGENEGLVVESLAHRLRKVSVKWLN